MCSQCKQSEAQNLSLNTSTVPRIWKEAVIHPIPKISRPLLASDLRPISVLPILSRVLEKIVNTFFLTPSLFNLPEGLDISNQFVYRPTSSTSAALIAMLAHITELLRSNSCVYVITFDYSKAFDTLRHTSVASKLFKLDIPDCIYNWIVNYLTDRSHRTLIHGVMSDSAAINASIVQGSALGPVLFNINSTDLMPAHHLNKYFKYADDAYLVIPGCNAASIPAELEHHANWAATSNLKLNPSKTSEIVFC